MLTHSQVWAAIDALALRYDMSASGLAKAAGLDPTTFNKSKRVAANGKQRWPSTESVSKILNATGASIEDFTALIVGAEPHGETRYVPLIGLGQAGEKGFFDDSGFPAGTGWDQIAFPELAEEHAYALEISGDSMQPIYRDGDRIIVSPAGNLRRGDRVVLKTSAGEVMVKQIARLTATRVELKSLHSDVEDRTFELSELAFIHRVIWASQ
ncbi:MAG TPA: helix-turn-helix transcriptional regulator [Rhizomicrobium sp.]|jgi:phage repressor protein C with HTH and peptisase S24 domain